MTSTVVSGKAALNTADLASLDSQREHSASGLLTRRHQAEGSAKTTPLGCLGTKGRGSQRTPDLGVRNQLPRLHVLDASGLHAPPTHARTRRPRLPRSFGPAPRFDRPSHRPHNPAQPRPARPGEEEPAVRCVCMCSRSAVSAPGRWWRRRRRLRRG